MDAEKPIEVAILDYGLGNLFSVKHACEHVGMNARITSSPSEVMGADMVILPGVGAFGDAMNGLKKLDLIGPLKDIASSGKILFGICLGMQLLMRESFEFGRHQGLGIIEGDVVKFENPRGPSGRLKVPQVGWNRMRRNGAQDVKNITGKGEGDGWSGTPFHGLEEGAFMYFVHSFYIRPEDHGVVLSMTDYGDIPFCSGLRKGNVIATQFHPERSGPSGLQIYQNLVALVREGRTV